ncbi:phospholipase A1-like [Epargyreus clarus]|uniref:phospholipase A1-like n=1 Tax=Epargyreus clarus TaxID=520877 RepID=UPI003C2E0D84
MGAALAAGALLAAPLPPILAQGLRALLTAAANTCETLPLNILYSRDISPDLDVMEYTRDGRRTYSLAQAPDIIWNNIPHPLIIYVPGWWNTPTDESSKTLVDALLLKSPLILVLDTRLAFCRGYVGSASHVNSLAHRLYRFIKTIHNKGYPLSSIHLIGFSLGAHVSGITGKLVQNKFKKKLERIIALDPARPCFSKPSQYRLGKHDAAFVQVVHTSAGALGLEDPIGHTDVYINGVSVSQPECKDRPISLECDHAQAWKLFSASIMNERSLMARKCRSWEELNTGTCSGNETMVGYECSDTTRGMFLHKSDKVTEPQLRVFNPFDPKTWLAS